MHTTKLLLAVVSFFFACLSFTSAHTNELETRNPKLETVLCNELETRNPKLETLFGNELETRNPKLETLSWLAGSWSALQDGVEMEELWLEPKGNTMLGLHRDVKAGRTVSFEFLRIEATPESITYWASPGGRPPTPFRLVEILEKRVAFENPEHDFPQRIIYWLTGDGTLHAKIEGTQGGKPASEEWTWRRSYKLGTQ